MPIIKWAKKALKVSRKKQVRNQHSKSLYTELRVAFEKAIKEGDVKTATAIWFNEKKANKDFKSGFQNVKSGLQSTIDKLVKKNLIHANNGSRKKAKFTKMLKSIAK